MRRTARGEQSAFSLFPFLAVLLCTMGAMVVLLVAMAYVSRQKAEREAEAAAIAATIEPVRDVAALKQAQDALVEAKRLEEQIAAFKEEGNDRLREEQSRLSDIEDHIRRLRDEAEELKAETIELIAVEEKRYDDEKAADQELARLNELIGRIEDEIEQMKHAAVGRERRFAVVPLRDRRTGTLRPPIYYECRSDGVVLQPEGVELTWEDLAAPGFSSPVAAASRATDRYYAENPEARAANEVGKPYPLLVVRPGGVDAYYGARAALENAGVDYGYQPIGDDWELEYGQPNPVLAQWVDDAIASARDERRGLAEIVPQLAQQLAGAGLPGTRGAGRSYASGQPSGQANGDGGIRVSRSKPGANNPFDGLRIEGTLPSEQRQSAAYAGLLAGGARNAEGGEGEQGGPQSGGVAGIAATVTNEFVDADGKQATLGQQSGAAGVQAGGGQQGRAASVAAIAGTGEESAAAGAQVQAGTAPRNALAGSQAAGKRQAAQRSGVPMIRPIRLFVAEDRVVVLPDRAQSPADAALAASNDQSVELSGATSAQINEVIAALKRHADSWGIAGEGMYWDPRLVLNVASSGARRADDLRQLLEAAGLKVQAYPVATAAKPTAEGGARATR